MGLRLAFFFRTRLGGEGWGWDRRDRGEGEGEGEVQNAGIYGLWAGKGRGQGLHQHQHQHQHLHRMMKSETYEQEHQDVSGRRVNQQRSDCELYIYIGTEYIHERTDVYWTEYLLYI